MKIVFFQPTTCQVNRPSTCTFSHMTFLMSHVTFLNKEIVFLQPGLEESFSNLLRGK
jgi:hypothetical protein